MSPEPSTGNSGQSGEVKNATGEVTARAPSPKPVKTMSDVSGLEEANQPPVPPKAAQSATLHRPIDHGEVKVDANASSSLEAKHQPALATGPPSGERKLVLDDTADTMTSSVATLRPPQTPTKEMPSQFLAADSKAYVDPTPPTPLASQPPSRTPSNAASHSRNSEHSPTRSDVAYDEKRYLSEDEQEGGSRSEIQSIMEQFSEFGGGPDAEEVMSPRLEIASPMLGNSLQHPPRKSSLEPLAPNIASQIPELQTLRLSSSSPVSIRSRDRPTDDHGPPVPPKDGPGVPITPSRHTEDRNPITESPMSPTISLYRPPPPEPEPEPTLPFDFHRFLEQLRNKKADPVARYLKSFLSEFGKRQWMVHEQVKIISDFLAFIANKMAQCDVWREVSDAEFDNAREGMEKLVMNRLYTQTFSPAIPAPLPIPGAKSRRKGADRPMGPGRRGQHQEDVERDDILTQKINIYSWVKEEHLDIPPVNDSGRRFLKLAQQGLATIPIGLCK
jgi:Rab5 GDP/GTP exchange factor